MLAFCAAFVWWLAECSPGKPEWAGGVSGSIGYPYASFTGIDFVFVERESWTPSLLFTVLWPFLLIHTNALLSVLGFSANYILTL